MKSAKILPVTQLFLSIQHNFCPFEFHPLQSVALEKLNNCLILYVRNGYLLANPIFNLVNVSLFVLHSYLKREKLKVHFQQPFKSVKNLGIYFDSDFSLAGLSTPIHFM